MIIVFFKINVLTQIKLRLSICISNSLMKCLQPKSYNLNLYANLYALDVPIVKYSPIFFAMTL